MNTPESAFLAFVGERGGGGRERRQVERSHDDGDGEMRWDGLAAHYVRACVLSVRDDRLVPCLDEARPLN